MPRINLLPWREQQRTDRKKAFGVGVAAAFLGALALAGLAYLFFGQMIESQQARNAVLREEIKKLDKQIEEINNLEQQKQQMIARMQIIEKLQQSRPEIVHVFDTFVKTIPDGTYLTALTQTEQRFKIQGITQSAGRVADFLEALEGSPWLKEQEFERIENKANNLEFTVYANQRSLTSDETGAAKATDNRKKP
jgi:type IV pilus assembly protein PilN